MKRINKDELLLALQTVYEEYLKSCHKARLDTCSLCTLYFNNGCADCPMCVFKFNSRIVFPCTERRCHPYNCVDSTTISELPLQKCIAFYEEIIAKITTMSEEELNTPYAFQWMIDVDRQIDKDFEPLNSDENNK